VFIIAECCEEGVVCSLIFSSFSSSSGLVSILSVISWEGASVMKLGIVFCADILLILLL